MDFIRKFDIELDKEIYYAGESFTGRIIVQNTENIRVQGIRLHLRGKAHAEWRITRAGERRTVKQDEHYIDERMSVWGKDKNEEGPVPILPRGNHKYPFEFKLPESALPCSFESKIGTIRYYIRVTIDIPYASCPQGIKYFTVVGPHIDCMDERFLSPVHAESKRYNCSLCCGKGPLWMKGTLERTAYCCGENVKLKVEVQNGCDEEVWIMVRMMQYVEYFINRGVLGLSKELRHTVIQMESPRVESHTTTTLDQLHHQLQVPIMPPTMVDVCGLVQIYYSLRICLRMEKSGDVLEAEMPVTIATVPFRNPSSPSPEVQHDVAADYVEGGMYISSEFQLGQVYMGDEEDSDTDKEILYRPVYVCVPHKRPTPRHKMRASVENKSLSPPPADQQLTLAEAENLCAAGGDSSASVDAALKDSDKIGENVDINDGVVKLKIIRDDTVPEAETLVPDPPRKLRDDIPEEGIRLPILICRDPLPVVVPDSKEPQSELNFQDQRVSKTEVVAKTREVPKASETSDAPQERNVSKSTFESQTTDSSKTDVKVVSMVGKIHQTKDGPMRTDIPEPKGVSMRTDVPDPKDVPKFREANIRFSTDGTSVDFPGEGSSVDCPNVTIIKSIPLTKTEFISNATDLPNERPPLVATSKTSKTMRQVHETASSVVVKTIETVKVKDVVVSQNESEDRQFDVSKSEQTQKEVSTERSQVTPSDIDVSQNV